MSYSETDKTREELITLTMQARTLPEIDQAEQELHQWLRDHPQEQGMRDGFEQLSLLRDCAEWRAENPAEDERFESSRRVVSQVYDAQTLEDAVGAQEAVCQWQQDHPGDDRLDTESLFLEMLREVLMEEDQAKKLIPA